jgi:capsular exopolysaccharide synthesis family protein
VAIPSPEPDKPGQARRGGARLSLQVHRIRSLIVRYWWLVALTIVIGMAIQAYRYANVPVRYISTARMMVSGRLTIPQGEMYSEEAVNFYGTQTVMMKSSDTLAQAVARVRAVHPEIPVDDEATVDAFQEARTDIFNLSVISKNPEYAPVLLDAVMDTYLSLKRGRKAETTDQAVSAITQEIGQLDAEIRADEQQLLDFQKQNNVVFIEEQSSSAGSYLVGLNNEVARLKKEHDLLTLENGNVMPAPAPPAAATTDPATPGSSEAAGSNIQQEQERIEKLTILKNDLSKYLKPQHPKIVALSDTIAQETYFLNALIGHDQQAMQQHEKELELQIQNLENQIADWSRKSLDLSQRLGTYEQLKSKVTREQALYNQLASSIQNVNIDKSIDQDDVSKMEPASPAKAIRPDTVAQLAYGAAFGALAGLAMVYLIHRLDDKIDSALELEDNFAFPLVGQIPRAVRERKTQRVALLSPRDTRHVWAESYRNIRSALLFRFREHEMMRTILVSSASPGEGKSTVAANLAVTFAFAGTRTLLIDADLRRGVLHTFFGVPQGPGLSDYLQQKVNWRQVVRGTTYETLDFLPRGKVPHQPGELLLGPVATLLLQESAAEYDLVIWDSPPLLAADDAANLCARMDAVIYVSRARYSSIHSIASALDILSERGAPIFGLILNAVEPDQPGYYDRYRYKEYYATEAES